jgi:CheY-like chemotaxis protein/DNA-directed RNA polymerase specialized sigma24 family protein
MSASALGIHLPLLRRYARALTGSQRAGDTLVAATLQALIDSPKAQQATLPARVGLYRAFSQHAAGRSPVASSEETGAVAAAQTRLSVLAPEGRQALLLTALEGFSESEAAQILGRSPDELEFLVAEARAEIALQSNGRVLIIEDEALIAMDLSDIVASLGHTIIGTATTAERAVAAAASYSPNLILADVQLADGSSGIAAVREILAKVSTPVIFITAFPERLLTGERPEPTFLISKPYAEDTVRAMISQVLFFGSTPPQGHAAYGNAAAQA